MTPSDREVYSSRLVSASPAKVFSVFADPNHLKNWWGPNGFTNTIEQFDFKPGGIWRFIMHGPDGMNYHNECQFTEITQPERIVFVHQKPIHRFQMTIGIEAEGTGTRFSFRMLFDSLGECNKVKGFVAEANEQNFDRLETELAKLAE